MNSDRLSQLLGKIYSNEELAIGKELDYHNWTTAINSYNLHYFVSNSSLFQSNFVIKKLLQRNVTSFESSGS